MFYDSQSESRPCLEKATLARGDLAGAVEEQPKHLKEQIQLCPVLHFRGFSSKLALKIHLGLS